MKNNWEETTLEEVCEIYTGNSINENIKKQKYTNLSEGYNYIATKDISINSEVNYDNGIKIPFKEEKFRICFKGSILLCIEGGNAGNKIAFVNQDVCFVNKLCSFKSSCNLLNSKFLFYYLQSPMFKKIFYDNKNGLIGGVSVGKIRKMKINLPPLQQQKEIVEKLDKAFANIDKLTEIAKQNLENSKELFNSYLNKLFTENNKYWEETTLNDICKKIFAGGDKPVNFSKIENKKYSIPVVANGIENDGLLGFTDVATVIDKAITISARGTIGFVCKRNKPFCPIVRLIVVIPKTDKATIDFLYYLLQTLIPKSNGSSIPQLTIPNFKYSKIKLPPLQQQKQIVEKLDNLQEKTKKLEEIYNKKLELAKELKQSVLHKELQPSKV